MQQYTTARASDVGKEPRFIFTKDAKGKGGSRDSAGCRIV